MYEFLDADGERVTVRSTQTLEMLLTQGWITGATRFRRAGEDEFGAAGSHPELQGIALRLGVALAPRTAPTVAKPPRAPERPASRDPIPAPPPTLPFPDPVELPLPPAPEPPRAAPTPWAPLRPPLTPPQTLASHLNATHLGFTRFAVVLGLLVGSVVAGLIVAGLVSTTRSAWLVIAAGAGTAWLAGRFFRRRHVFSWRWDGLAPGALVGGFLLLRDPLGVAYACAVAALFTKGARPG